MVVVLVFFLLICVAVFVCVVCNDPIASVYSVQIQIKIAVDFNSHQMRLACLIWFMDSFVFMTRYQTIKTNWMISIVDLFQCSRITMHITNNCKLTAKQFIAAAVDHFEIAVRSHLDGARFYRTVLIERFDKIKRNAQCSLFHATTVYSPIELSKLLMKFQVWYSKSTRCCRAVLHLFLDEIWNFGYWTEC